MTHRRMTTSVEGRSYLVCADCWWSKRKALVIGSRSVCPQCGEPVEEVEL